MYKEVVRQAFEKAKKEIPGRSNKTSRSEYISNVLLNDFKYQISGKTLRNHYDKSVDHNTKTDIAINSEYVQNLCLFLGYEDYKDFVKKNSYDELSNNKHRLFTAIKKNKVAIVISLITIVIVLSVTTFNKQRWMIWEDTHYIEVDFDAEKYSISQLKMYNQERIDSFKSIIPNCDTKFYNIDGTSNLWYGKNNSGELEYFTGFAIHPETGKTLKAITDYMIKKYICENY